MQSGGQNSPLTSLTDPAKLIEDARVFASKVTPNNALPTRVYFTKYSAIPTFVVALGEALLGFNNAFDVMNSLVGSYQLALDRQRFISRAISTPSDFQGSSLSNTAALKALENKLSAEVKSYSDAASVCASNVQAGKPCDTPKTLDVEPLPDDLQELPICSITAQELTQNDGCKQRIRIGSACYCTHCQFGDPKQGRDGDQIRNVCPIMPPGKMARVIYNGTMSSPTTGPGGFPTIDTWYQYHLGKNAGDFGRPNSPASGIPFNGQEVVTIGTGQVSDLESDISILVCQPNWGKSACTVGATPNGAPYYLDIQLIQ
jgi:hypothetical protein